jgi:uncharacterized protein YjbI with pentapeptide repeats
MTIQIKSRDGVILYTSKAKDLRAAVEEAVKDGVNLSKANLAEAVLRGVNLSKANLAEANLSLANLARANLSLANLAGANLARANLSLANLAGANLAAANLCRVDLAGVNLSKANLYGAILHEANLSLANLAEANLSRVDLFGVKGVHPEQVNDLLMLYDQPGKIRAYKLVTAWGYGPFHGTLKYEVGKTVKAAADTDATKDCAAGINLATLPWCLREWQPGYRILVAEFTAADIAAIPIGGGKFRVSRCRIVGEKDLADLGLTERGQQ